MDTNDKKKSSLLHKRIENLDYLNPLKIKSNFSPKGDQPAAIKALTENFTSNQNFQTLLGVTGSGKTFTVANVIQNLKKPTLILAPNKTLAAQLYSEFKALFPENAVEYFVSYYDYYQPEAYVVSSDTFIEKDSSINEEIDKVRHSATRSLLERKDVIIVASVSCIYGLGSPQEYLNLSLQLKKGMKISRNQLQLKLIEMYYQRSDQDFHRGTFRVRGDIVDLIPMYEWELGFRIEFFGNEIESINLIDPLRGARIKEVDSAVIYPGSHYVASVDTKRKAIKEIQDDLQKRLTDLADLGKAVEAQRLENRTLHDLEMMQEVGYCSGVENYSRYLSGRKEGEPPPTLIEYFPKDWLLVIDESHVSVPQVGAMYKGDRARKTSLVEHGFRLPSALDNRPLKFTEFEDLYNQVLFVSATPGDYEFEKAKGEVVEQIIRPTGLLDPTIEIRPAGEQVQDLLVTCRKIIKLNQRILITTLTKKMAEDLTAHYRDQGIKVRYMHSDVETLERIELIRDLRSGVYDVLVGINLLREGLDLPEVSLVAILDADREGFLRSKRSLIQTMGRAARNVDGHVILYADKTTKSMKAAIDETTRRREIQHQYNLDNNITPETIKRGPQRSIIDDLKRNSNKLQSIVDGQSEYKDLEEVIDEKGKVLTFKEIVATRQDLEKQMKTAAKELEFEKAAKLRDKVLRYREMELNYQR